MSTLISAKAQFLSLTSETSFWSLVEIHCLPGYNSYTSRYYAFKGDTVIGETIYKKLYATEKPEQTEWYFWGLYREDTTTGKVWYRSIFPEIEGVAYDFSAQPGDTVFVFNPAFSAEPIRLTVQEKTSIEIGGKLRRQLKMWEPQHLQSETWIEGIGSLYGIKNSGMSWAGAACGSEELLCFWENEINIFQNPAYATCFFEYTGKKDISTAKPQILYLPINKSLTVNSSGNAILIVYNLLGKEVMRAPIKGQANVPLSGLSPGFYAVRFIESNRSLSTIISL
ncbi:MAG: T9SS type A sorting domain-containing protein [Bacteroidales bacterium]